MSGHVSRGIKKTIGVFHSIPGDKVVSFGLKIFNSLTSLFPMQADYEVLAFFEFGYKPKFMKKIRICKAYLRTKRCQKTYTSLGETSLLMFLYKILKKRI